jgi:hypothetical protein
VSTSVEAQWAWAKTSRAFQHFNDLAARISVWRTLAAPRLDASISDDRLAWSVRVRLGNAAPLAEWALLMGDVVHNLRAALDVLIWANAETDNLEPRQRRELGFPLVSVEAEWADKSARLLRGVSPIVVERVRACQPFQLPLVERSSHGLLVLHELDVLDKHRLALSTTASAALQDMALDHTVEFADDAAAERNVPPDVTVHKAALVDGALLISGKAKDPITKIHGTMALQYQLGITTDHGFMGLLELLQLLSSQTSEVVTYIEHGSSTGPPRAPIDLPG